MSTQPAQPAQPAVPAVIGPSRLVRMTFAPLTKILNPVIVKLAGRRHVRFAAQIRHTGRRSGRPYVTPASAQIRLNGVDYQAERPQLADTQRALQVAGPAFRPLERAMFRMLGIHQFLLLKRADG